jgi:ArsR family transcriptional regulator, arsenate/arsenite/antimonite-responsive transcriptional repressor
MVSSCGVKPRLWFPLENHSFNFARQGADAPDIPIPAPFCLPRIVLLRLQQVPMLPYFPFLTAFRRMPGRLDMLPYFCNYRIMRNTTKKSTGQVAKFADMFSAMGTEARLRIMQLLLSAHPDGMVVGELQEELQIPDSTLSHHLDKLRNEELVQVRRESTFLRYTANTEALQEVLRFLYAECCTRNKAVEPRDVIQICK